MQQTLFGTEAKPTAPLIQPKHLYEKALQSQFVEGVTKTKKEIDNAKYTDEYCFHQIESEGGLWDMRCWDRYHDREEVLAWLDKREDYANSGHTRFCINILLDRGIDKQRIADSVLKNNEVWFKNRLVKCFHDGRLCPYWTEEHGYSGCKCSERCK